ncbi:3'-5' exonuclease family protein [Aurantiacibacter spongiae]|uniref:Exonuclease domain-containing protein n=1 Tax=Aurantiacibacter spongiae TaxID=2488860 RepID=A0A3N5DK47_9SPHN|nr:hypothetical protein [Aurantiacibacter spongiae]RPF71115.1 hypothetical protein EG799_05430 [Aurantiacibacter spongiae]
MEAEPEDTRPLPWPLHTIDFEASSLDDGTYPIEVGVARWVSPDRAIESWSSLISPPSAWTRHGSWSTRSAGIHGISREELAQGLSPQEAMRQLNEILGTSVAYCDGGGLDRHWLAMLQHAAGRNATFDLGDFAMLAFRLPHAGHQRLSSWLQASPAPHRGRQDAERLMKALARGLGVTYGQVIDLA